jgi:hypothetical protein
MSMLHRLWRRLLSRAPPAAQAARAAALSVTEASGAWPVVSTRRQRRGWCMPTLIKNMQYHYTDLIAFEDGVVDCWEGLDLALFREKLKTGWVATTAPVGAMLSVFNLGCGTVDAFEPLMALSQVEDRVAAAVRDLNPNLAGLVDLNGSTTELRGKVRFAKLPALDGTHYRIAADSSRILAKQVPVFVRAPGSPLRLTRWFVYADGTSRVGPDGWLVELGAVEEEVLRENIVLSVPDRAWIDLDGLGRAKLSRASWGVDPRERIKEQRDHLAELQGGIGAIRACIEAWEAYGREASPSTLEALRNCYVAVPEHLRMYCGDMDTKDSAIRATLAIPVRDE